MRRIPLDRRLLWLAPALAITVALGPFGTPASSHSGDPTLPGPAPAEAPRPRLTGSAGAAEALPSTGEVMTALAAVVAVGAAGLWLLGRARRAGAGTSEGGPLRLRQSLRLGSKSWLHAVEFDGRVVLVGDGEHGPTLLTTAAPEAEPEADGADLRDTLIPRPAAPSRPVARPRGTASASTDGTGGIALGGFDDLLRRARRTAEQPR